MEREVSAATGITITLVVLSVLLSMIFYTVSFGYDMKNRAAVGIADIRGSLSSNYIRSLMIGETDNDMPAATAYNILRKYDDSILEVADLITGEIDVPMIEEPSIHTYLTGRVQLEIIEVNGGSYIAIIHNGSDRVINDVTYHACTWKQGVCTCPHKDIVAGFKSKYGV